MSHLSIRAAAIGLALTFGASPVLAQASGGVVVVNVARIFQDSAAGKYALSQLRPQNEQLNQRTRNYQTQFQKEEQALQQQAQAKTLTQPVLQQKAQDLQKRAQTANEDIQARARALQASDNAWKQQVLDAMNPILQAVMKEKNAVAVIPSSVTLGAVPSVDVTADVMSRLDRALPRVNLTAPATTAPAK